MAAGRKRPVIYADHLVPAIFAPWVPIVLDEARIGEGRIVLDVRAAPVS